MGTEGGTSQEGNTTNTSMIQPDDLVALQRAILSVDGDNDDGAGDGAEPLTQWYDQHGGDASLIVRDPHMGTIHEHGTPLYIATVLDAPGAVGRLLSLGSDPHWAHPVHGDTCLLHASERGYVDCLQRLLAISSPMGMTNAAVHRTVDRKIFLGQGMPQYQEGGLNPLHVASVHGRLEAVQVILEYDKEVQKEPQSSNKGARHRWLDETDSFGQSIVQMVGEAMVTKKEGSAMKESLRSILHLLADRRGDDLDAVLAQLPDASEAKAAERERQRALRARCLCAEQRTKDLKRKEGLRAVARSYVSLHPEVLGSTLPHNALAYDLDTIGKSCVKEPLPGVFTFPLFRREFCLRLWEELHHYETVAGTHPEKGLPLDIRHDGNLGNLQDCGLDNFLEAFQGLCQPLVDRYMPDDDDDRGPFEVYHAFLTRNSPELEKNATFKLHRDKSDLTFNVCLHKTNDVIGSTVGFYNFTSDTNGESDGASSGPIGESSPDAALQRAFTYEHEVGSVVFHNGSHHHITDPIQRGERGSLILWARLLNKTNRRRPKVGEVVRLAGNARVRRGVLAGGRVGIVLHDDHVSKEPFRVGHAQPERNGDEHSYYHVNDLVVVDEENRM